MKRFGLFFWVAQFLVIILAWSRLPPQLPLFYSRPWGEDQLTTSAGLLLLPVLSFLVFFINFIFFVFVPKEEKLMRQILTASAAVFSLLCLVTLLQIIKLVV